MRPNGIALRQNFLLHHARQLGTLSGLLVLGLVLWALTPHFLTLSNLLNVAEQATIIAIVAVGMTFVILTAGIDLSVGSVLAFAGVVMASALHAGAPLPFALLAGLVTGTVCGLVNGLLITLGRLPPFIVIAGMMYELDAIAATVIGGTSLLGGEGNVLGTLIGALIMAVLRNGLNLLGVSSFLQQVVIGSVIIVAVLIDMALKRRGKYS